MNSARRTFLRQFGAASASLVGASVLKSAAAAAGSARAPQSNMCGFAAPALPRVRIGIVGVGSRGTGAVRRLKNIEQVEIKALADIRPERLANAQTILDGSPHRPERYTGGPDAWKRLCERDDIDLVYCSTHWALHAPVCVYAMEHGKHAVTEIPAAQSIEECWQLVETSERTRKHCMMLENCCYDFFELLTLNMAQQGFFGEIIHGEGAYIHDLLTLNFRKDAYYDMWRLKENMKRNGDLYPMHGLGPIAQIMNINRGDRFDYLVSVSSNDYHMAATAARLAQTDEFFRPYVRNTYRGNMNTTTVRTVRGRTIMLQHDVTSPRPYSRLHLVSGTAAMAQKYPLPPRLARGHEWMSEAEMKKVEEQYTPVLVKRIGEVAKQIGGHGGMDFLMDWRLIDCLRHGVPLDMDVYDAAAWSAVGLLSEKSVANRSAPVDVPDFTGGAWQTNRPVDLSLKGGGTTTVHVWPSAEKKKKK